MANNMEKVIIFFSGFLLGSSVAMMFTVYLMNKGSLFVPLIFTLVGITLLISSLVYNKRKVL